MSRRPASWAAGATTSRSVTTSGIERDLLEHDPPVTGDTPLACPRPSNEAGEPRHAPPRAPTARPTSRRRGTARSPAVVSRSSRAAAEQEQHEDGDAEPPDRREHVGDERDAAGPAAEVEAAAGARAPGRAGLGDAGELGGGSGGHARIVRRSPARVVVPLVGFALYRSCGTRRASSAPAVGERPGGGRAHSGDGEHRGPRADLLGERVRHAERAVVHRARGSPRSPGPRASPTGAARRTRRPRAPHHPAGGSW